MIPIVMVGIQSYRLENLRVGRCFTVLITGAKAVICVVVGTVELFIKMVEGGGLMGHGFGVLRVCVHDQLLTLV